MLDLSKELKAPMEDTGWIAKILIGVFLVLISHKWYLFPLALFPLGYIYQTFVNHFRMEGEERLPDWKDWKELFVKGLVFFLISFGYLIIPYLTYNISQDIFEGGFFAKTLVGPVFMAVTALLYVAALFFLPMGIAQYTHHDKISDAFNIPNIWDKIMKIGDNFFKIAIFSVAAIVAFLIVRKVPAIGLILASIFGFYVSLVFGSLFGKVCREAWGEEAPLEPSAQEEEMGD